MVLIDIIHLDNYFGHMVVLICSYASLGLMSVSFLNSNPKKNNSFIHGCLIYNTFLCSGVKYILYQFIKNGNENYGR